MDVCMVQVSKEQQGAATKSANRGTVSVHEHKDAVLDGQEGQSIRPEQWSC